MNPVSLIVYSVADMSKSKDFFVTLLGTEPYVEGKPYIGFKAGEMEIGLVQRSEGGQGSALAYVTVGDIKTALATLVAGGAQTVQDVTDVGYGMLVASVKHADGTTVGLRQFPSA